MPDNLRINGLAVNDVLYLALNLEGIALARWAGEVPQGVKRGPLAEVRRKAEALHRELASLATAWALEGVEGITGLEATWGEDDEEDDWKGLN